MATKTMSLSIRVDEATLKAIQAEADSDFEKVATVAARRLMASYASGSAAPVKLSPMAAIEMRKKEAEATMAEQRAAIMRGEYVKKDVALAVIAVDFANIKSRIQQIPNQISGLTPEQNADGDKAVQDCFTDLSAAKKATWDDLAEQAAESL